VRFSQADPNIAGLSEDVVEAIVGSTFHDPFSVLGVHQAEETGAVIVRAFVPGAQEIAVLEPNSGGVLGALDRLHDDGLFAGVLEGVAERIAYQLQITDGGGVRVVEDPYRFHSLIGETDLHLLAEGTHLNAHERLGAHPRTADGVAGVDFVVWAPNAKRVSVVGDFNQWDGRRHCMRCHPGAGLWEIFIPDVPEGSAYAFEIRAPDGRLLPLKADPFGFAMQRSPGTASLVCGPLRHEWQDQDWLANRAEHSHRGAPISIYEVHLGSWRRIPEEGERFLSYQELADQLVPYVRDMGFTHIQLMPVSEYPFDGSWGYQPIGLFAPTSRFGTPEDFCCFVDRCHQAGLGVLIDWVPGHFPTDPHGLGWFDGTHLYEHADPRRGFHQDWNTLIYNYGRNEVLNFLISNALFWLDRYHIDGLRVDAVASMLYLDYSRAEGEWLPNVHGGRENLEAVSFLRRLNELCYARHDGIITIAEESTAWPGVSRPTWLGGLGFGYKWNMGWMHDTLSYMSRDAVHRRFHHNDMTFGLLYAYTENFMLPLSHDEVVHGKGSLIARMPGDAWQRYAGLRAYFGFMWMHPGKKLLFMGGEFAQEREWSHDRSLDWHLLDYPPHQGVQRVIRDLNRLYCERPAAHVADCEPEGFQWLEANDAEQSVLAWLRYSGADQSHLLVVCNFTPVVREACRIGVPQPGMYREVLNTDSEYYGGSNVGNGGGVEALQVPWQHQPCSLKLTLPPLATMVLEPVTVAAT